MVILKPPPIPKIDHEVPWIKSRFQEEQELKAKSHDEDHEPPEEAWEEEDRKAEK